jgi:hypothetical protein
VSDIPLPICKTFDCRGSAQFCHKHASVAARAWLDKDRRDALEQARLLKRENEELVEKVKKWQELAFGSEGARKVFDERNRFRRLLIQIADDDECRYDHDDACQTHSLHERPCPYGEANVLAKGTYGVNQDEPEEA